jgi:AsmA protein
MSGTFAIADGVLSNRDFRLAGPVLSMSGAGNIDIGNRELDFRLVPKASARGLSIGIPFRVKGSWEHVHYAPDLGGVMNGVIQNLENGRAPFKGLFGGGNKTHDQGDQPKKKKKNLGDALKSMFGIH